jgi:hypothetical protein
VQKGSEDVSVLRAKLENHSEQIKESLQNLTKLTPITSRTPHRNAGPHTQDAGGSKPQQENVPTAEAVAKREVSPIERFRPDFYRYTPDNSGVVQGKRV